MGMYCEVSAVAVGDHQRWAAGPHAQTALLQTLTSTGSSVSLEKAWHGLHYLLTGDVWEGHGPLAFLLAGGELLGSDDEAPARWFTPEETAQIHQALSQLSDDELWARFDPVAMEQNEIYPGIWDEPEEELQEEYLGYFQQLKQVVEVAARNGQGLIVTLG